MAINTGSFGRALWPGINAWYGKAYDEFEVEYTQIFTHNTSKKSREEDVSISSFSLAIQTGEVRLYLTTPKNKASQMSINMRSLPLGLLSPRKCMKMTSMTSSVNVKLRALPL